jgi:hypothetical protein
MNDKQLYDKQLNEYIDRLLSCTKQERIGSNGGWAASFDTAMARWTRRHPGTRPPCFAKVGPPPPCFSGEEPPIYEGDMSK